MADLSVDQPGAPSIDQLVNAVGDLSAPDTYIPPRSGTYRTSRYPGFFTAGQTPSNTPNPVAGDNAVALPPTGVDPNAQAASPSGTTGLSSVTSNPVSNDPSEGADQRQATALDNARTTGFDTNPDDFAKAMNLATSVSPTGMLGLAAQAGLNKLGVFDPLKGTMLGDTFGAGEGGPFDFKSNDNSRPGYDDAFTQAQGEILAKNPRYTTPQNLANQTQQRTRDILDAKDVTTRNDTLSDAQASPTGFRGTLGANAGISPSTPAAPVQDVTAANKVTGFQQPTSPSDRSVAPGPTQAGTADSGLTAATPNAPTATGPGAYNGQGRGGNGGGGSSGNGNGNGSGGIGSNAGRRGFSTGGVVSKNAMKPHHKVAASKNHQTLKQVAAKTGKTVPAIVAMHKNSPGEIGNRARLEAHVMKLACGGKVKKYAAGGTVTNPNDPQGGHGNGSPRDRNQQTSPFSHPDLAAGATPATPWVDPDSIQGQTAAVGKAQYDAWLARQKAPQAKAAGGVMTSGADPSQSDQYNPPADATQGNSDTVPAVLTPGEMVITKPAASQYSPDVLQAMNDPQVAAQIDQLIEQFLSDQGGQGGQPGQADEDAADGGADDASEGDGASAGGASASSADASGLGAMAPMRGIPSPKSKLASVTRAA